MIYIVWRVGNQVNIDKHKTEASAEESLLAICDMASRDIDVCVLLVIRGIEYEQSFVEEVRLKLKGD